MSRSVQLRFAGFLAMAMCSIGQLVGAQTMTPSHVFQTTQMVIEELKALNKENYTKAATAKQPDSTAMPRHVLFLARDQWRKTQALRFMNGLDTNSLANVQIATVTPGEVKALVDRLLVEVRDLRPAYGLDESDLSAPLVEGKKPTDVYGNLLKISAELQALGIPATVPNDVFRVASNVTQALGEVVRRQGLTVDYSEMEEQKGLTPVDAYRAAVELLNDLDALTSQNEAYAVPGQVWRAQNKTQAVTPDDVIQVLSGALADIVAIMNKTGAGTELINVPYIGGKTPSDVFNEIARARMMISALQNPAS